MKHGVHWACAHGDTLGLCVALCIRAEKNSRQVYMNATTTNASSVTAEAERIEDFTMVSKTLLQIAIVQHDCDSAKWLLDRSAML